MKDYQYIKKNVNLYSIMGFSSNPFSITPLFRTFKSKKRCEQDEKLFILAEDIAQEVNMLTRIENRRILIYGHYGTGKTSLVDFILYIAHCYRKKFCIRLIITEDNIHQAMNEILLNICQEILSEIAAKKITEPISAVKKWITEHHYSDLLLESLLKLMGSYQEEKSTSTIKRKKRDMKLAPQGIGMDSSYEEEIYLRKTIQSYVQVLPMSKIIEYLELFHEIIIKLGYQEIIIFIDEADHMERIDQFLKFLTKAREILFSKGYTFFVCGSIEIAKFTESMGAIFDKIFLVKPADKIIFQEILTARIKDSNPQVELQNIFENSALEILYSASNGIQKHFIRMAENALDFAISTGEKKITRKHCMQIIEMSKDSVSINLNNVALNILRYLSRTGSHSSSDPEFQETVNISRAQLRKILEELFLQGYLHKIKKGRKNYYTVTAQYLPYFSST